MVGWTRNQVTRMHTPNTIKRLLILAALVVSTLLAATGCVGLSFGGGSKTQKECPTLGRQLIDLQKAKESGAITEPQYEAQKAKLLRQ